MQNTVNITEQDGHQTVSPKPLPLEAATSIAYSFRYLPEENLVCTDLHMTDETTSPQTPLNSDEKDLFAECEANIRQSIDGFYAVGKCLYIIKTQKLYREHYKSFEDYCASEWGISRVHANRQIEASQTVDVLKNEPIGSVPIPKNESQARMLAGLTKEQKIAVAKQVKQSATDDAPTAKDWEEAKGTIAPRNTDMPQTGKAAKTLNPQPANIQSLPAKKDVVEDLLYKLDEAEAIARKSGFIKTIVHIRAAVASLNKEKADLKKAA